MESIIPYALTFLSASIITYYRVYTNDNFHNYFFLIYKKWVVIFCCLIYGLVGLLLWLILKNNVIAITGDNTNISKFLLPIGIGVAAKGVSDINFFNVKTDGFSIPIGLKLITQPLDKFFEDSFMGVTFVEKKAYLTPIISKYTKIFAETYNSDIAKFKQYVLQQLKDFYTNTSKIEGFEQGNEFKQNTATPEDLLNIVLSGFGKTIFESIFP